MFRVLGVRVGSSSSAASESTSVALQENPMSAMRHHGDHGGDDNGSGSGAITAARQLPGQQDPVAAANDDGTDL